MALELRQQLKLSQQLIMTPQLQMAIKLLQLSRLELVETIRQELEENPTLEEIQESATDASEPGEETPKAEAPIIESVTIKERLSEDIDWTNYIDEYNAPGRIHFETESRESPGFEPFLARPTSLQDHLLWQLLMTAPTPETERIGSLIAGNLNGDGYLEVSTAELAEMSGADEKRVEEVLALMQTFDPVGVCARHLTECLLIQLRHFNLHDTLVTDILQHHLHHLENKNYKAICKALRVSLEEVARAVNVIRGLEPRPGRQFTEETPQYITPDIYVYKVGDEYVIMLNDDG
ncbi:MAG: RNA polymerase sigma-54 factor, partial [Deltaproteobacteria bacterium]